VDELARDLSGLSTEQIRDRMERYIRHRATTEEVPGAAAALFRGGTPVLWIQEGLRDNEKVAIASLTKPFTALLAVALWRDGQLDLDSPFLEYLSIDPVDSKLSAADRELLSGISIRQLLMHRSGIPYSVASGRQFRIGERVFPLPDASKSGKYRYSNFNYQILRYVLEAVGGDTLASLKQKWILKPAGMKNTIASGSNGAAGMISTLEDLTRFCEFLLAENHRPESPFRDVFAVLAEKGPYSSGGDYVLGWHLYQNPDTGPLFFHSGTWYNAAAEIYIMPESRSYFVHIANPPDFKDKVTIRYRSDIIKMGRLALIRSF
jgi:CubicO group peptidase (beta-lactamase class C family)